MRESSPKAGGLPVHDSNISSLDQNARLQRTGFAAREEGMENLSSATCRCWVPLVLGLSIALAGCAPTVPEVQVLTPLPRGADPALFVTAARQKEEITRGLRGAGFRVVDHIEESPYLLRVTIGVDQGSQPCGTLNNVRYDLRSEGRSVIVAEAKGWTGSCDPNVFDAVSREFRRRVVEMTGQEGRLNE